MSPSDCLFCKIAAKEIPVSASLYEDEKVFAFLDLRPRAPGHTLVIPKYHARNILELPEEEITPLFVGVKKVGAMLVAGLGAHGITIGVNQGRAAGQEVDHLHVHLLPRFENDGGSSIQGVVQNEPKESLAEIAKKIINQ